MKMNIAGMNAENVAQQPRRLIARICRAVPEMQARFAEMPRRLAQQFADLQGSSARSVSR